jgi:hypothetical protein
MSQPILPINQVPIAATFASGALPSILGVIRQHPISVLPRVGHFKALLATTLPTTLRPTNINPNSLLGTLGMVFRPLACLTAVAAVVMDPQEADLHILRMVQGL